MDRAQRKDYLPEYQGELSDLKIKEAILSIVDSVGFRLFGAKINNLLREQDYILDTSSDRDALVEASLKRQMLTCIIDSYYTTIEYQVSDETENSPIEA